MHQICLTRWETCILMLQFSRTQHSERLCLLYRMVRKALKFSFFPKIHNKTSSQLLARIILIMTAYVSPFYRTAKTDFYTVETLITSSRASLSASQLIAVPRWLENQSFSSFKHAKAISWTEVWRWDEKRLKLIQMEQTLIQSQYTRTSWSHTRQFLVSGQRAWRNSFVWKFWIFMKKIKSWFAPWIEVVSSF